LGIKTNSIVFSLYEKPSAILTIHMKNLAFREVYLKKKEKYAEV